MARCPGHAAAPAEVSRRDDPVYRVLVLANETVGGRALLAEIQNRCKGRNSEILVVVPALTSTPLEPWASDVDRALDEARERLDASLASMEAAGLPARGYVGDHHEPNASLEDALRDFPADEVIVSTHPPDKSRWLERGVVARARQEVPLPVTHVVVDLDAEARATAGAACVGRAATCSLAGGARLDGLAGRIGVDQEELHQLIQLRRADRLAEGLGHHVRGEAGRDLGLGSTMDCLTSAAVISGITWSRSGPTVPDAPIAFIVWQPEQPFCAKTVAPGSLGMFGALIAGFPATAPR